MALIRAIRPIRGRSLFRVRPKTPRMEIIINCQLSIKLGRASPTVNCQLSIVNSQLSTVNYQLSTVNYHQSISPLPKQR